MDIITPAAKGMSLGLLNECPSRRGERNISSSVNTPAFHPPMRHAISPPKSTISQPHSELKMCRDLAMSSMPKVSLNQAVSTSKEQP